MCKPLYPWPVDLSKGFSELKRDVPELLEDHAQHEKARELRKRLNEYERDRRFPEDVRALVEEYVETYEPY